MKKNNNKKGFTLVEILIVLVVAAILLALIIPNTIRAIESADLTQIENDVKALDTAAFMCFSTERLWANCDTIPELTGGANPYLETTPLNPFGGTYGLQANGATGAVQGCHTTTLPAGAQVAARPCAGN